MQNKDTSQKLKVLRIATTIDAFIHIKGQLEIYASQKKNIVLVSDVGVLDKSFKSIDLKRIKVKFKREIAPISDILSLLNLIYIFIKEKPDVIHSSTPKAGLLCALAGFVTRVPKRIHTFTGQRWATLTGLKRSLLIYFDKLICLLNTEVYSDSKSQNQFLISNKIVKTNKIHCIHKGSLGGIDLLRFNKKSKEFSAKKRAELSILPSDFVFLFLGRIHQDKGIFELAKAFKELIKESKTESKLLIVGPNELDNSPNSKEIKNLISSCKSIILVGETNFPEDFYAISNVLCVPSYREGFGTVVLEAAAMGVPSIGSDISGLTDSIQDQETGLLFPLKDVSALKDKMKFLLEDSNYTENLGNAAAMRAHSDFNIKLIAQKQWEVYSN